MATKGELLASGREIARRLHEGVDGTPLRVRIPNRAVPVDSDGWRVTVGNLGTGKPKLQIWLDRFAGYDERKFWAGFYSSDKRQIRQLSERVPKELLPVLKLTPADLADGRYGRLAERLNRKHFHHSIFEEYDCGTYFGIYDPTLKTSHSFNSNFCARTVAFFKEVAATTGTRTRKDEAAEVYPQYENRTRAASHVRRERSGYLAAECKIRDGFECQVCGFRFEEAYGFLGSEFAEAHHLIPLSKLSGRVRTRLEDLVTVCANCHRMLHRMNGQRDDLRRLRLIWKRSQRRWATAACLLRRAAIHRLSVPDGPSVPPVQEQAPDEPGVWRLQGEGGPGQAGLRAADRG